MKSRFGRVDSSATCRQLGAKLMEQQPLTHAGLFRVGATIDAEKTRARDVLALSINRILDIVFPSKVEARCLIRHKSHWLVMSTASTNISSSA